MRPLMILALLLALAGALFAEIRVVSTTSGGKTQSASTEVREIPEGGDLRILQESEEGSQSTLVGGDGAVKSAEIRAKEGTFRMNSDGKFVDVSGTWNGKAIAGRYELKGLAFYGSGFEFALRALARAGLKSLKFPMIQLDDPSKGMVMELSREGRETFKGREAIKVKVCLTGIMAAFWSAHFLIAEDGTVLKYKGTQGPGTPEIVTELVEIRQ